MDEWLLDEGIDPHLIPYLVMNEEIGAAEYQALFESIPTEKKMVYFYFDGYEERIDAIKIFAKEMKTEDAEGWVILIKEKDKARADEILKKQPTKFHYFEPLEHRFFKALTLGELVKLLLSKQLKGPSLKMVLQLLETKGVNYTEEDVKSMRMKTKEVNREYAAFPEWGMIVIVLLSFLIIWNLFF